MNDADRIEEVEVEKDAKGNIQAVRFAFGPHYFVQVQRENGKAVFYFGATHHGIKADASEVNGELERFVEELKTAHPKNSF
jgi:hypothetical protein